MSVGCPYCLSLGLSMSVHGFCVSTQSHSEVSALALADLLHCANQTRYREDAGRMQKKCIEQVKMDHEATGEQGAAMDGPATTPKRIVLRSLFDAAPPKPTSPGYGRQIRKLLDVHNVLRSGRCLHCEWMRERPVLDFLLADRPFYHPGSPRESPDGNLHTPNPQLRRKRVAQPHCLSDDRVFKQEGNNAKNVNRKVKAARRLPKGKVASPSHIGTSKLVTKRHRVAGGPSAPFSHPAGHVVGTSSQPVPPAAMSGLEGSALEPKAHSWASKGPSPAPQTGTHTASMVGSLAPSKLLTNWATSSPPSPATPLPQPPLAPAARHSPSVGGMPAITSNPTPSTPPFLPESFHMAPTFFSATAYQPSTSRKLELPAAPRMDASASPSSGIEGGELFEEQSVWYDLLAGFEAENQTFSNMTASSFWDPSLPYFSTSEADHPFFSPGELGRSCSALDYQEGQGWPSSLQ